MAKVIRLNGTTLATPRTTAYAYGAAGSLLSTTLGGGTRADASDDLATMDTRVVLNRLDALVAKRDSAVLLDQNYAYV